MHFVKSIVCFDVVWNVKWRRKMEELREKVALNVYLSLCQRGGCIYIMVTLCVRHTRFSMCFFVALHLTSIHHLLNLQYPWCLLATVTKTSDFYKKKKTFKWAIIVSSFNHIRHYGRHQERRKEGIKPTPGNEGNWDFVAMEISVAYTEMLHLLVHATFNGEGNAGAIGERTQTCHIRSWMGIRYQRYHCTKAVSLAI